MNETANSGEAGALEWRDFLTDRPPGTRLRIDSAAFGSGSQVVVAVPELQLHCDGRCGGISFCKGTRQANGQLFGARDPLHGLRVGRPACETLPEDAVLCYTCEKCGR